MKKVIKRFAVPFLAAALILPASLLAQDKTKVEEKEKDKDKKGAEQIIITRKGESTGKLVVEVNGDKILVNGKEVKDNNGDVTVRRNKIKDMRSYSYGGGNYSYNFNNDNFRMMTIDDNRAMLGVTTDKVEKGAQIQDITDESAAAKAGLKKGDIITRIDDKKIETPDDLSEAIKAHKPGEKVNVAYLRDNKEQKLTAELGKWKGTSVFTTTPGQFKMELGDLDHVMPRIQGYNQSWSWSGGNPRLGMSVQDSEDGKGVKVLDVDDDGNAAKAGIKEDDVITDVDGKAVNSADEVAKIMRESKDKISVKMGLVREGKPMSLDVKIPRKLKTADL